MGFFKSTQSKSTIDTTMKTKYDKKPKNLTPKQENPYAKILKQELLLQIPGCTVHLMDEGEAMEIAKGEYFSVIRILDDNIPVATVIKVGDDLQWPLTKDEPVVKLDSNNYLFTLPMRDGDPLSYGVSFLDKNGGGNYSNLGLLDSFLKENSCFSGLSSKKCGGIEWKEFAPKIDDYNNVLAKAIAGGTGQIVKGIFKCSNAYTNQVQRGGEMILTRAGESNSIRFQESKSNGSNSAAKMNRINKNSQRVRKLSKMTEKLSKSLLDGVGVASGSVMRPLVNSKQGKAFLAMVPGEVLLASLDCINKILDAAEAAEKQVFSATSDATTRMVTERFGESAGEATGDVLATAGHIAGTAWNVFKIRKALLPSSAVKSGVMRNAANNRMKSI